MSTFLRRLSWVVALFLALVVIGVVGYVGVEGWGVGDSLYMTVITLTAVGYEEVRPLSDAGRLFTMILLGLGVTWLGLWFALLTSFLVELDLNNALRRRRIMKRIARLRDHVVVCGAGRTGGQVIAEVEGGGVPWVAIERDVERVAQLREHYPDGLFLTHDATDDDALAEVGLERARGLVTCLSEDTDNLFVCLSARDLVADVPIVARANSEGAVAKLRRAGATHVVSPSVSGAAQMASMVLRPSVTSFLEVVTQSHGLSLRMEQAAIHESSPLADRTLAQARIPQTTGLIVIALKKSDAAAGDFTFNPTADTRLAAGDEIIVLGTEEQLSGLHRYMDGVPSPA